jgi:hypothetical protein
MQEILKRNRCYDGVVDGINGNNTQEGLDRFIENAGKKAGPKPGRIEVANATVGDFESWLKDANPKDGVCAPKVLPKANTPAPVVRSSRHHRASPTKWRRAPAASGRRMAPIMGIQ